MKTRKINKKKLLIFIAIFFLFCIFVITILTMNIKNIYVLDNKILTDQEIIDTAGISNYPNFFITLKISMKNKLLKNDYINNIKIEKKLFGKVYIYIEEKKPLFYKMDNETIVFENKEEIKTDGRIISVPILSGTIDNEYYEDFITQMSILNTDIISKISQIEYSPNEVDPERFLLYMKDGNYVYLTLYTFSKLNSYNEIIEETEGETGILYLDLGNYFEILD